ncbi:MAG: sensor histidine kinase, partial [Gemmatimonadota bacterium]
RGWPGTDGGRGHAYTAALPIFRGEQIRGALLVLGSSRDPFAVLDKPFLLALGHQVGAALAHADLFQKLEERKVELERLAARMVHQQEEERRRLSRELHDESAQVFTAVKLQLGMARETAATEQRPALDRAMDLVGSGIRSIREVARNLRPSLLDDLGLLPALRALSGDYAGKIGIPVGLSAPESVPELSAAAELALYRALQEALSNVARHSDATAVDVDLSLHGNDLVLSVRDDGKGPPTDDFDELADGRMGLAGMRERALALGGTVELEAAEQTGTVLRVRIPLTEENLRSGEDPAAAQGAFDPRELHR